MRAIVDAPKARVSRADLAKAANVSTSAITQLLGSVDEEPKESSTRLMLAVHKCLGWAPPDDGEPKADELRARIERAWPSLDETDRAIIDAVLARRAKPG